MFDKLKQQVAKSFEKLSKNPLFCVTINRDEIWNRYLAGFPDEFKQEHNCNACRSFLRQFGNIVGIVDNKIISIWDNVEVPEEYADAIQNLRDYIHSLPITDVFLNSHKKCGTDRNLDIKRGIIWQHYYIELPNNVISSDVDAKLGQARDSKHVLKRSLEELTIPATEDVLELIEANTLYRGREFEGILKEFLKLQKEYKTANEKDNFCWSKSIGLGALARIRNTSIGTLLIDLSEGVELDVAVTKFERVVAPSNYKRTSSLVTPKMIEQAKKTLAELGLLESLNRRFATETDINVTDVIFKYRPSPITDVFAEISKETLVNPRNVKAEEISIDDFLTKIIPTAKSISVLLENSHFPNFVSLLTAQDASTPSLFKWNNHFSWSYSGEVADSIKEKVKQAGGRVEGELRVSLAWHNYDDLDLHEIEPNGNHIYFSNKVSSTSGHLDLDMNAGGGSTREPVENIIHTNKSQMKEGLYRVRVHNYAQRERTNVGFAVQIEHGGEVFDFEYNDNPKNQTYVDVAEFEYSKTNGIKFKTQTKSNIISKEKWGLKSNQFHKVTKIMLSPNHWAGTDRTGNKHYFFTLQDCVSSESVRPFYNEFLKPELNDHRKTMEILSSKLKIEPTSGGLSGLGFSSTVRNSFIVLVQNNYKKYMRILF